MSIALRQLTCLALLATIALLPACKKAQDAVVEAAVEKATGVKVNKDGAEMTVKTEQGDMTIKTADDGGSVALPTGFPDDIYMPDAYKVASAMDMAGMQMVNLTAATELTRIYADADKAMQAGGWKREVAMQTPDSATLAFSKDQRQVFYQLVKADDGGTQLAVRVGTGDGG